MDTRDYVPDGGERLSPRRRARHQEPGPGHRSHCDCRAAAGPAARRGCRRCRRSTGGLGGHERLEGETSPSVIRLGNIVRMGGQGASESNELVCLGIPQLPIV
ncbi:MAG: hypothetical protein ACE5EF_10400 [Dehalococcoidia bacterium]